MPCLYLLELDLIASKRLHLPDSLASSDAARRMLRRKSANPSNYSHVSVYQTCSNASAACSGAILRVFRLVLTTSNRRLPRGGVDDQAT